MGEGSSRGWNSFFQKIVKKKTKSIWKWEATGQQQLGTWGLPPDDGKSQSQRNGREVEEPQEVTQGITMGLLGTQGVL